MENRFGATTELGQPAPARVTHPRGARTAKSVPDEINIGERLIRGPVSLEIVQKRGPVAHKPVPPEAGQRKREPMVDTHNGQVILGEAI